MVRFLRAVPVPLTLVGMLVLAGLALGRIYHGPLLAQLVAGAAVGSVAVSVAARRLPSWLVAPLSMVALALYAAWTLRLSAQHADLPGTLTEVASDAVRNGIPRLLTALIPVEPQPDTVIVPVVATWLAGLAGAELAVRGGRVLLGYGPPTLLYAGALYVVGPNASHAVWPPLTYVGLAAAGLAATARSSSVPVAGASPDQATRTVLRLRLGAGAAAALAVVVALAAAVGPAVAARVTATPVDPRRYVPPPQVDSLDENPLIRISGWALNPDQHLLDVAGLGTAKATRVRLAVLNDYDGVTWHVGATYRNAGRVLPAPGGPAGPPDAGVTQDVTIADLTGRLLPAVATPREVDGVRVAYDNASGTLIRPEGLAPGLRYSVTSTVDKPDVDQLPTADVPSGPAVARVLALGEGIPPELERLAEQLGEDSGSAYDRALAVEEFISTHYRLVADAPSGHAYPNLTFFLFGRRDAGGQRGTSEQFAASFAVLGRMMGLPTRVVVGFQARPDRTQIRGADALAWPEVLFTGVGWVPFDPLPRPNTRPRPVEEDFQPKPEKSTPPPSEAPTPSLSPTVSASASEATAAAPSGSDDLRPLLAGGAAAAVVVLIGGYASAVSLLRRSQRRRRLTEGDPGRRVTGAWLEVTDALRLAGRPAQPYLDASEVATHAATAAQPRRAHRAGRAGASVRPPVPPLDHLTAAVNQTAFAPLVTDDAQARRAATQAVAYVTELRSRRSWWRRVLWSFHPGPLRWHRKGAASRRRLAGERAQDAGG
jgi:Transglutaminase-like superfamily/TgpA N-terminal domain